MGGLAGGSDGRGADRLEITDLLWPVNSEGERLPVARAEVLSRLAQAGQNRAVRIVSRMPAADGLIDAGYVDALGLRVHCELQRLSEELQMGRRVAALLGPIIDGLRTRAREGPTAAGGPIRVVDIGCGLGYVVRWLAATSALGAPSAPGAHGDVDVELWAST
jgi:hypothetical protein